MTEKALALLTEKKFSQLKQLLSTMNPVDLAGILEEMRSEEHTSELQSLEAISRWYTGFFQRS